MTGGDDKKDIVEFQPSLVRKLQNDLADARATQVDITKGSRIYLQRVQVVHQAVVFLLEQQNLNALISALQEEVCILLGYDLLHLYFLNQRAMRRICCCAPCRHLAWV